MSLDTSEIELVEIMLSYLFFCLAVRCCHGNFFAVWRAAGDDDIKIMAVLTVNFPLKLALTSARAGWPASAITSILGCLTRGNHAYVLDTSAADPLPRFSGLSSTPVWRICLAKQKRYVPSCGLGAGSTRRSHRRSEKSRVSLSEPV